MPNFITEEYIEVAMQQPLQQPDGDPFDKTMPRLVALPHALGENNALDSANNTRLMDGETELSLVS